MTVPVVVHGHFYQPPRENPWTEYIDGEPSAAPFPDWNTRIQAECYRPNAFARVVDSFGQVERIVNNYRYLSFNFGPTLLSWMEAHDPVTYQHILAADRESAARLGGHGNAIAQSYNHSILPLCNPRDRVTQVRWGLADFRRRFGREPEGMWLPETACNADVLEVLIEEGLTFTILSPYQAEQVRPLGHGDDAWQTVADGNIDTGRPYRSFHRDGSGRSLVLFFYDGPMSRAIAFEGALASSQAFLERFRGAARGEEHLVHVATDGESYGHHTKFGDRTLAHALKVEAPRVEIGVTNYGAFLAAHPPTFEVQVKAGPDGEGTAWSCTHGVGRWYRDCGCRTGGEEGWNQAWRTPLRQAFDVLRDEAGRVFEAQGGEYFHDPWAARDAYIELVLDRTRDKGEFLRPLARRELSAEEGIRALTLLEMQRQAMLMYTSCGWFFNELSGIETVQVMKYGGRLMDDLRTLGVSPPRAGFLEVLSQAHSNLPSLGSGADVYRRFVDRSRITPQSIAAHLGISSLMDGESELAPTAGFRAEITDHRRERLDRRTLLTNHTILEHVATGLRHDLAVAAMHFGGVDFYCVVKPFTTTTRFRASANRIWREFGSVSLPKLLRTIAKEFGPDEFGLDHVLPGARRRIFSNVFGTMVRRFSEHYASLYEDNQHSIEMLEHAGFELPWELRTAAEYTMGRRFEEEIRAQQASDDPAAYQKAVEIAEEAARHHYDIDMASTSALFGPMIASAVEQALGETEWEQAQGRWQTALSLVMLSKRLGLPGETFARAQEIFYQGLMKGVLPPQSPLNELGLQLGLAPTLLEREATGLPGSGS
jgi:alpha-amylase/alpha-mannosidase (GH57 family)